MRGPEEMPRERRFGPLTLRRWRVDDALALRRALDRDDAHLRPWVPFMRDEPRSFEETRRRLEEMARAHDAGAAFRYAIVVEEKLAGEALVFRREMGWELGYWVAREATGRGLATAAARGVAAMAFGALGVERLTMRCDVRNLASNRVAAKLGATPTGEEGAAGVAGEPVVLRRWELRADGMNVAR